jgi:hypothetical protein
MAVTEPVEALREVARTEAAAFEDRSWYGARGLEIGDRH